MASRTTFASAAQQLDLFVGTSAAIAARDAQDLMAWPFFSLAKSKRVKPIDFRMGDISILVEATAEHGMATIWDADVLIWVASQIVEARDAGKPTSRLIAATPHEILTFTRRGTGKAAYERLASADNALLQARTGHAGKVSKVEQAMRQIAQARASLSAACVLEQRQEVELCLL